MIAQETDLRLYCETKAVKSTFTESRGAEVGSLVVRGVASNRSHVLVPAPNFDYAEEYHLRNVELPTSQADRFVDFYRRYLSLANAYNQRGWNGHSFVAAVVGMAVEWGSDRRPRDLRIGDQVDTAEIGAHRPYMIVGSDEVATQSLFSIGNGEALGVVGYGASLQVMPLTSWQKLFPGTLHEYVRAVEEVVAIDPTAEWQPYDLPAPAAN